MTGFYASLTCAVIQFGMALFQLSLACGAPFGEYALGGQHRILPKKMRPTSAVFVIIFTFIGFCFLQRGGIVDMGMNRILVSVVIIINTLFMAYAIVGNAFLTKSRKERYVMTPISAVQFVCSILSFVFTRG